jgi:hypothetical protein
VHPNPVTDRTAITYQLSHSSLVSCLVYDAAGNLVARLSDGSQAAGTHSLRWNAAGMKPGIYFCKLVAGGGTSTARLVRAD